MHSGRNNKITNPKENLKINLGFYVPKRFGVKFPSAIIVTSPTNFVQAWKIEIKKKNE